MTYSFKSTSFKASLTWFQTLPFYRFADLRQRRDLEFDSKQILSIHRHESKNKVAYLVSFQTERFAGKFVSLTIPENFPKDQVQNTQSLTVLSYLDFWRYGLTDSPIKVVILFYLFFTGSLYRFPIPLSASRYPMSNFINEICDFHCVSEISRNIVIYSVFWLYLFLPPALLIGYFYWRMPRIRFAAMYRQAQVELVVLGIIYCSFFSIFVPQQWSRQSEKFAIMYHKLNGAKIEMSSEAPAQRSENPKGNRPF